jgi:hypothetical protein
MQHTATIKQVKAISKATNDTLKNKTLQELGIDSRIVNSFIPFETN